MALGELLAVVAKHVGDVRVDGRLVAERRQDLQLLRRVRDVVGAADHVRDRVVGVLDGVGEVVRRAAVGADEHEVLELLVGELDAAQHRVVPARDAVVGHAEADRALVLVRLALFEEALRSSRQRSIASSWNRTGPSQSIPSQESERWICSTDSATSRLVSVFSMRSRHSPPRPRANSQLKRNVRTPPMWRKPVGTAPCGPERSSR